MNLNKYLLVIAITYSSSVFSAGIPVVDAVGNAQELAHWTEKLKQWTETVQHYKSQLQAYKDQLATSTGLRDIQGLVSQGKSLKNDIISLQKQGISLDSLLTSSSAPSGTLDTLYKKFKDFDICDEKQAESYINICKQETVNKAWAIEQTADVQEKISDALNDISDLTDRMANAKDIKESQDLANAIQAKSIQLNILSQQWEINMKSSEQRDKLLAEKRRKAFRESQITAPVPQFN
ncbi:type IV secretion system protein [Escherichia coli]|uniref:type IV secretion system protein n=1 Tax=Escherichia coli TaxID=562 RepID=UPI0017E54EB9|nr:type IV secretion system protein [Escherichia coli]EFC4436122.1 type IV secretion system protein VirB5 [Escherichia coli]EFD2789289.1 type IV secretion system protein VirB5 [Escherichia coli]EGJ4519231.1 type IV secretion system protein VirB5 [Escherichia coli]EGJ4564231.1 type IV secretion system protein VirB5 [Escherichia coli]EJN9743932.1 type IV secretion system protein [Escherichia coli]